jgi:hypothetical protein
MPEDSAACSGPSPVIGESILMPARSRFSYGSRRDPLLNKWDVLAGAKVDEIFKRILERGTTTRLSADRELVEGAPVTALLPRIQPHGTAGEILDFALDFVHWVRQTSVV